LTVNATTEETHSRSGTGSFLWPAKRPVVLGLFLVLATLTLYWPVSHYPFTNLDDDYYITRNAHVKMGLGWDTVEWAFASYEAFNWHPLTWISHAIDFQIFQLNPHGHHDTNLVLHVLNIVLLFWVLQRATGYVGRSFMVAALFALHPINVESVVWISERKNLLSMFFFLLALGAYRWYAREPQIARYAVVALLYACGLMSKPQVITFPCVLLLWDYWPLRRMFAAEAEPSPADAPPVALPARSFSWLLVEKLPLFALAVASAVITTQAQRAGGAVVSLKRYPFSIRLENAIVCYARYLGKAFWPKRLSLIYPHPGASLKAWVVLAALVLLLTVTALVLREHRRRYLVVGWFCFLGTLVPMIGLVQVGYEAMADRYAYLSFLGLFLMICWGVADWYQQQHLPPAILSMASIALLLAIMAVAHRQVGYWRDNVTLWSHVSQAVPLNSLTENRLGNALLKQGQEEEAMEHYYRAAAINPSDFDSNLNVAFYEQRHMNLPDAIKHYQQVLDSTQDADTKTKVLTNMGYAYRDLGDSEHAQQCFQAASGLRP
jgi:protein O-mannosyl-transferase